MLPEERAQASLAGLSVGDAFGQSFFGEPEQIAERIRARALAPAPWEWTDDTAMARAVVAQLRALGGIDPDLLARRFARDFLEQPQRGYGSGARRLLERLARGESWQRVAPELFEGGSLGNGAAMRVGPLGAYFAGDPERIRREALLSAQVTHAHPEGQAGAIAVALAAGAAWSGMDPLEQAWIGTPEGAVRAGLARARELGPEVAAQEAVRALGNGARALAEDTVPLALWCAARHLDDYREALWTTVSCLGDRDTTCAIVGSIVVARSPLVGEWLSAREPLD